MNDLLKPQPSPKQEGEIVYHHIKDFLELNDYNKTLQSLCHSRYLQGIKKYGQPLMSDDGRDTLADVLQEMLDLLVYLMKGILQGKDWKLTLLNMANEIEDFVEFAVKSGSEPES